MPTLAFYISGHGFGHASRDIEIINAVGRASPSCGIIIRSAAPQWLFDLTVRVPFEFHRIETDTGIVQRDSLSHDIPETLKRAAAFYADFDRRVEREAEFLRSVSRRPAESWEPFVVIGDIPPLAFAAAARAGLRSHALGNFTWDWIYDGYEDTRTQAPGVVRTIREAYTHAADAWRLPMHGGFESISRVVDVPFVARHASHEAEETRRAFGLPLDRKIVLSSFGGYGLRTLPLETLDCLDEYAVVVADATIGSGIGRKRKGELNGRGRTTSHGLIALGEEQIYEAGFRYEDLVRAADVVLTKPGYGIISECVANHTALVYTSRGAFREYDVLVREMPKFLRCAFIDHDALFSGRWRAPLDRALAQPEPPTRPATDGAAVVAGRVLAAWQS